MKNLNWIYKQFGQLSNHELYELIKLRIDVFVVEQACVYPDLDEKDRHVDTWHVLAYQDSTLLAYARLLPPGLSFVDSSIGRLAVHGSARHQGLGSELMRECIEHIATLWPGYAITISAQEYLTGFYEKFGFNKVSGRYIEDGIPHIDMCKAKPTA